MKILRNYLFILILLLSFSYVVSAAGEVMSVRPDVLTRVNGSNPYEVSSDKIISGDSDVYIPNGQIAGYKINVEEEGKYIFEFIGKSATLKGYYDYYTVEIRLDGKMLRVINIPHGEKSDDIFSVETRPFTLTSGEHTISVVPRSGGTGLYMNEFVLNPMLAESESLSGAYKDIMLPCVIEAEDFDYKTWQATDNENYTRLYRKGTGIDIYPVDSDEYYIELKKGEHTDYTFDNEKDGIYAFSVFCFGGEGVNVYFDSFSQPLQVKSNEITGNSRDVNLYIPKGTHTVRLEPLGDVIKVDNITFIEGAGSYLTLDKLGDYEYSSPAAEHSIYKNLYVSNSGSDVSSGEKDAPFATISRAKEEVRKLISSMTGDIIVNIESGYYELESTEIFDMSLSGIDGNNVVFRGTDKNNPPVISGGTKIDGWEKYNDYMWRAPAPDGIKHIRNLYINNIPATRAASKYLYKADAMYDEVSGDSLHDGFVVRGFTFPQNLTNHSDIELVFPIEWTSQYVKVNEIEYGDDNIIIHADRDSLNNHTNDEIKPGAGKSFSIENAFELLDEPGEFYFNKSDGYIYYYPYAEENMNTAEVFVGRLEKILSIIGSDKADRVHNLIFDNLDIRYSSWDYPSENGFYSVQADGYYNGLVTNYTSHKIPAAVEIKNAENIDFVNNRLTCHGLVALAVPSFSDNINIAGNLIADISASGISIGSTNSQSKKNPDVGNISIRNNIITRVAAEFRGSIGIVAYYAHHVNIEHNKILDVPYTGISLGWEWIHGQGEDFGYFTVRYNEIDTVMTATRDGSHIYCLGPMRYSDISYNYLTNANLMHKIGGIYFDSGCKWAHAHHNVITNSPSWFHMSGFNWIFGHRIEDNFSDITEVNTYGDPESLYFEYPTKLGNEETSWDTYAKDIKAQAGLEEEFSYLNELSSIPSWRKSRTSFSKKYLYAAKKQYDDGEFTSQEAFMSDDTGKTFGKNSEPFNVSAEGITILNPRIFNYSNASEWYWYDAEYKNEMPNPDAYPWFSMTTDNSEGIYVGYDLVAEKAGAYRVSAMASAYYKESGIEILRPGTKDNKSYTESIIGADILLTSGKVPKTGSKSKMTECDLGIINLKKGSNRIYFRNMRQLSEACYVGLIKLERVGDYAETEPVKVSVRDYTQKSWFSSINIVHASNSATYGALSPYTSLSTNRQLTFSINAEKDGMYVFTIYQGGTAGKYDITIGSQKFSGITPLYNESSDKTATPVISAIVPLIKGTHTVKIKNTGSSANLSFFTYQRIGDTELNELNAYVPTEIVNSIKSSDFPEGIHSSFIRRYGDIVIEAENTKTPTYTDEYIEGAIKKIVFDSTDDSATGIRLTAGDNPEFTVNASRSGYYRVYAYVGMGYGERKLLVSTDNSEQIVDISGPLYCQHEYISFGEIYLCEGENKISLTLLSGDSLDIDYIGFRGTKIEFFVGDEESTLSADKVTEGIMTAKATLYGFSDRDNDIIFSFVIYKGNDIAYISSQKIQPYDGMTVSKTIEDIKMEDGYEYTAKCFVWNKNLSGIYQSCK